MSRIGYWYPARLDDGSGWMCLEITGDWQMDAQSRRVRPAIAARTGLTEAAARSACQEHNRWLGVIDA